MSTKPAKGGPRHIKLTPPNKAQVEALRADAYALVDFPELLDDKPEWRQTAILIARAFIAQNPHRRVGPRNIAAMVDEVIDTQVKRNVLLAQAVRSARSDIAAMVGKSHEAVKMAHVRHGKLGKP